MTNIKSVSEENQKKIVDQFRQGFSKAELARVYGTSARTVGRILANFEEKDTNKVVPEEGQYLIDGELYEEYLPEHSGKSFKGSYAVCKEYGYYGKLGKITSDCDDGSPEFTYLDNTYSGYGNVNDEGFEDGDITLLRPVKEGTTEEAEEVTFEVGDIITWEEPSGYGYTTVGSTCEVLDWNEASNKGEVKILSCETHPSYVGNIYPIIFKGAIVIGKVEPQEDTVEEKVEEVVQPNASYIATEHALVLTIEGQQAQLIDFTHGNFEKATQLCHDGNYLEALEAMDIATVIEKYSGGAIEVDLATETLTYKGMKIANGLVDKILGKMSDGDFGFEVLVKFFEKTMANPAPDARRQLMEFAAASNIDIAENGNVVAFKNVKDDYKPSRAGMYDDQGNYQEDQFYDNSVGSVCKMPRELVDDDIENTCSHGLHVASLHYLEAMWGYNGRTMKVEVNPEHFVAIPTDYNNSKARVCEYTVVEDVTDKLEEVRATYVAP